MSKGQLFVIAVFMVVIVVRLWEIEHLLEDILRCLR